MHHHMCVLDMLSSDMWRVMVMDRNHMRGWTQPISTDGTGMYPATTASVRGMRCNHVKSCLHNWTGKSPATPHAHGMCPLSYAC
jgi:hypothetical protein